MHEQKSSLAILERAQKAGRLGHALLLHGECLEALEQAALHIAGDILSTKKPLQHADFFCIRPANKMRQIGVEPTRNLIQALQQTPMQGEKKVALVIDADRFHTSAANAFLKTLEEPASDTTILLLSTRLHGVLPTLRSRCQHYRFNEKQAANLSEGWTNWLTDYDKWLLTAAERPKSAGDVADRVMGLYALCYRFEQELGLLTDEAWQRAAKLLPENTPDEEKDALEVGTRKNLRRRLFASIAETTRYNALSLPCSPDRLRALTRVIDILEHNVGLLEVNLNEATALETYLLNVVRLWIV